MKNHKPKMLPLDCNEELAVTCVLTCEELGFLMRLRMWAACNGGIPASLTAKAPGPNYLALAFRLSNLRFARLWGRVLWAFAEVDGVFLCRLDQNKAVVA